MPGIERTVHLREQAINLVPQTIDRTQGTIKASDDGRYAALYGRDAADSITQVLPHPENHHIPGLLAAAVRTIEVLNLHRGQKSVAETGEAAGRAPHEIWTEDSPQDRLKELKAGGLPVRVNPQDRFSMINYFGGDTTPKLNQAIRVVAETVDAVYSPKVGDLFLQRMWPHIEAGIAHDVRNADQYGQDVIVSDPRNRAASFSSDGFLYQSWRDGVGAYIGDEEKKLHPPFILFPNVCHYLKSLTDSAEMAERLGYSKEAIDLRSKAEHGREQLDKLFWMEDEQFYAPLVDRYGQIRFISCDPIDGLYCGVLSPDRARMVIQRLMQPDMKTRYGLRTRSSLSPRYTEEGFESYQNGTIWPNRNTMAALGMIRYGFIQEAISIIAGVENFIEERGFSELAICTKDEEVLLDYRENGLSKAPQVQSWFLYGYLGVSAWLLRRANLSEQVSSRQPADALVPLTV